MTTILVVDDQPANRYATVRTLEAAGFDVRETGSGRQALQLALGLLPDLILLDLRLPDVDGFEVCRRLKADPSTAAVPVVMNTAAAWEEDPKALGLKSGAVEVLVGAVESAVLLATIRRVLGQAGQSTSAIG